VNEAAISAMIIMITFQPWGTGFPLERFLEALIGGCTALAVNALLPINPERMVSTAAHPIFDESVAVLEETAAALDAGDFERACALVCFNRSRRGLWNRLLVQNTASG
jgi:uncharacterized membrane protein YgaE (UPF0421/DUF939 family)